MTCPRCGNEWDVSKSPCSRCGLLVRLPGRLGSQIRDPNPAARAPRSSSQPGATSPVTQSQNTGGVRPTTNRPNPAAPSPAPRTQRDASGVFNTSDMSNPSQPLSFQQERHSGDVSPMPRPNPFAERSSLNLPLEEREKTPLNAPPFDMDIWSGPNRSQGGLSNPDHVIPKSVPSRPQASMTRDQTISSDTQRQQPSLRPSRLVTESPHVENLRSKTNQPQSFGNQSQSQLLGNQSQPQSFGSQSQPLSFGNQNQSQLFGNQPQAGMGVVVSQAPQTMSPQSSQNAQNAQNAQMSQGGANAKELRPLTSGTLLRSGRYRLRELKSRQEWQGGVYESMWIAQDAQRSGSEVVICELVTPESGSMLIQSFLRTATMALTSIGRHPRIPTLWDAFGDQGRNFFVFEPVEGESLLAYMRRTGRALPELEVIECCLQMTEILELLAMQSPPLLHGLISPERIIKDRQNGDYVLTDFSVVLAGGATQFVSGIDHSRLLPYMAPEFARGNLDTRSDLYSLLATAYHAVTGSIPAGLNGSDTIPQAQQLNPNVSLQFNAILAKGLLPNVGQRYQRPAELRQELLALRSRAQSYANPGSFSQRSGPLTKEQSMPLQSVQSVQSVQSSTFPKSSSSNDDLAQILPNMLGTLGTEDEQEHRLLLPRPEELPPLRGGNDKMQAALWLGCILVCLIIVVLVSRGLV